MGLAKRDSRKLGIGQEATFRERDFSGLGFNRRTFF